MSIYDDLQTVTSEIMTEFKQGLIQLVQFVYPEDSTPDNPGEPEEVLTELDGTVKGVSYKYLKDSFITTSDKEVTTAVVNDIIPSENDFIEIDGVRYKILQFQPLPSAGTACAWKFIVRKGG
jgi:hypothetical protein